MRLLYLIIALLPIHIFALEGTGINPNSGLIKNAGNWNMERLISYGEEILIKVVLPLVVVGVALYVGYHLLTAEGDEEKMKKAFKSLTYSSIGLIAIACSYAFVAIISGITL